MIDPLEKIWNEIPNRLDSIRIDHLRAFQGEEIIFKYPLTVICGPNGTGKTSILSAAACAYSEGGTPGDYFKGSKIDGFPKNSKIEYSYSSPVKIGFINSVDKITHTLEKFDEPLKGQRWVSHKKQKVLDRPFKVVVYFTLKRAIPTYEKKNISREIQDMSQSSLIPLTEMTTLNLKNLMDNKKLKARGQELKNTKSYALSIGTSKEFTSLNMGTGQEVIISFIDTLDAVPEGSLILIDEVEVGLHPQWQSQIMEYLKNLAFIKKCQIILTTHSPYIIDSVPFEARIIVERSPVGKLIARNGVSSSYALRCMGGHSENGLCIFVEDEMAMTLLKVALKTFQKQVEIQIIGDKSHFGYYLGVHYQMVKEGLRKGDYLAVGDGDFKPSEHLKHYNAILPPKIRGKKANSWYEKRTLCLPGMGSPEKFIAECCLNFTKDLSDKFGVTESDLISTLKRFQNNTDKHRLVEQLETLTGFSNTSVGDMICLEVVNRFHTDFDELINKIHYFITADSLAEAG